jgi:Flp pilus assembly protein TadD
MRPFAPLLLLVAAVVPSPARAADPAALPPLLEGLDLLESGKYADAVAPFSRAIQADSEDHNLWIARGVAKGLAEKPDAAEKDFLRAQKLDPQDNHVRLWLQFCYNMKGDFQKASVTYVGASRDQYENLVIDTGNLYGRLAFASQGDRGGENGEFLDKPRNERAQALTRLPDVAAAFVDRTKSTLGDLGPLLAQRAKNLMADRNFAAALANLDKAQQIRPSDIAILHDRAICNLNLGAAAAAREQFTRVLTANPAAAPSFAGRATAAAVLGDAARAASDLDHATRLDPGHAADYKRAVDEALRNNPPAQIKREDLSKKVEELIAAAKASTTEDDLLNRATAIIKGANAYRLRSDETYFDRRLRLEDKARSNTPDALADLGEFLYREATVTHVEKVEPRADAIPYRPQDTDAELRYAEQSCDRALATRRDHVKALTYKALCLMARLQWGDAETLLKHALQIDPTYGPLLDGMAKLLNHAAAVRAQRAFQLRQTQTWETTYYYYWRHPSPADLAQADALDRQARQLWELARKHLEAAAKQDAGKPLGYYYTAILAKQQDRPADARAAFEECVRLDPAFQSAWDELAVIYAAQNLPREAAEAKSRSVNLVHTTAGHMLRYAWGNIPRTRFKTATEALARAIDYDPADPRACAYLGVIDAADEKPGEALACFRAAAALDEARSALNGTSLRSAGASHVPAAATGFTMSLNNRLGQIALERNRPDVAVEAFRRNVALERRVPQSEWFTLLPVSMLPDTDSGELGNFPEADAAISLFMTARAGLGQALIQQGKTDEGLAQLRACLAMPRLRHPTQEPVNRVGPPWLQAKVALLRVLIDRKDWDAAWREKNDQDWPAVRPSREQEAQYLALAQEIDKHRAAAQDAGNDRDERAARQEMERRLKEYQQKRDADLQRRREESDRRRQELQKQRDDADRRRQNVRQ